MNAIIKKIAIAASLLLIIGAVNTTSAQGINFFEGTFAEAKEKAVEENKLVFVDTYAVWCGPCRAMDAGIFKHKKVGEYFNENFISVKIDVDTGEGREFTNAWRIASIPTLLFFDSKGEVVHRETGLMKRKDFLELGKALVDPGK